VKLHLGCGARNEPSWINIDEYPPADTLWDLRDGIPYSGATHIYTEHFLEHLSCDEGRRFLKACHGALLPGGAIRISVPDLRVLVDRYLERDLRFAESVRWLPNTPAQLLNEGMRLWKHEFLYDAEELKLALANAGFQNIRLMPWGVTNHPGMLLEARPNLGELIMEATK
jgi:predicted SAM-dependent methyltransferase